MSPAPLLRLAAAAAAAASAGAAALASSATVNVSVALNGGTALHRYDGHGGLSAGASSRLLWDYAEPQRSQILDYLFNVSFGAGMHHLKLEIGGDGQSTDGTEPSHMHSRGDLSCARGYELWLAVEARRRNPRIALYGLAWTAPGWLNDGEMYGPDTIEYMLAWLRCVRERGAGDVTELGFWNEDSQPSSSYVLELRAALDNAGFGATRLAVMDNAYLNHDEVALAQANASYAAAIGVAGLHDPCSYAYVPFPEVRELGWSLWASEDFSRDVSVWADSQSYWMKALSQHYVVMNITATISWSLIWSVYSNLICRDSGLMRARWPQSGYYEVSPTIWLQAHWGQFVQPGWRFLHVPGGGSGFLDVPGAPLHAGTYVSLVPENDLSGLTVIIETSADTSCLQRNLSHFSVTFSTSSGLPGPGTKLFVWTSTQAALFVQQAPIVIAADSTFSVAVVPDSITTVSTTAGATHGSFPDSPVPAPLPWGLPFRDDFDEATYAFDSMARFFADQAGSWAVRNGSLTQVSWGQPIAWAPNGDPLTIVGSEDWIDYAVSATAVFSAKEPTPRRSGRAGKPRRRRGFGSGERSGSSSAAVYAVACDVSDGAQVFAYNATSGWLGSSWGGSAGCVTTCGCDTSCIQMWACGVPGCGVPFGGASYNWSLSSSGTLSNFACEQRSENAKTRRPHAISHRFLRFPPPSHPRCSQQTPASRFRPTRPRARWRSSQLRAPPRSSGPSTRPRAPFDQRRACASRSRSPRWSTRRCAGAWADTTASTRRRRRRIARPFSRAARGRCSSTRALYRRATPPRPSTARSRTRSASAWPATSSRATSTDGCSRPSRACSPQRVGPVVLVHALTAPRPPPFIPCSDDTYSVGNAAVGAGWHPASFLDFEVTAPFSKRSP